MCFFTEQPHVSHFQRCIDLSCIPSEWKLHIITPLFKKGDHTSVTNYRPISLLCSISKVLERLIFNFVSDHILPYLSDKQFGFIPNRSCLQQLLSTFSIIYQNYLAHKQTDIIFLDFAKHSIPFLTTCFSINYKILVSLATSTIGSTLICLIDHLYLRGYLKAASSALSFS